MAVWNPEGLTRTSCPFFRTVIFGDSAASRTNDLAKDGLPVVYLTTYNGPAFDLSLNSCVAR